MRDSSCILPLPSLCCCCCLYLSTEGCQASLIHSSELAVSPTYYMLLGESQGGQHILRSEADSTMPWSHGLARQWQECKWLCVANWRIQTEGSRESLKDRMLQSNRKSDWTALIRFYAKSSLFIKIQRLNNYLIALRNTRPFSRCLGVWALFG